MYLHLDPDTYKYNKAETEPRYTKLNNEQVGEEPRWLRDDEWEIISRWKQRGEMTSRQDGRRSGCVSVAETDKTEKPSDLLGSLSSFTVGGTNWLLSFP